MDVFDLTGRGTVVFGPIDSGVIRTGDRVAIVEGEHVVATATAQVELVNKKHADPRTIALLLRDADGERPRSGEQVRRAD